MTLQPEPILPDSIPTFFSPPLQYTDSGALKRPDKGIDRKSRGYPDFTDWNVHDTKRNHMRDCSLEDHSARELCEHPNSLGPDFVNKGEMLFCDMETGKLWPLCDESRAGPCFILDARQMQHVQASIGDEKGMVIRNWAAVKEYKQYEKW
ncbi:hypothetical protein N8T08_008254 [Aspergillus melleus]|uniref:Uncharacterized protein n=1 Tax=Aspergillus melleus TaxID=138277 RepID=A0ACC3AVW5_9EURO|nr:hypothetical protein N8T08_008254 [Aspergillus melleus]